MKEDRAFNHQTVISSRQAARHPANIKCVSYSMHGIGTLDGLCFIHLQQDPEFAYI